MYVLLRNHSTSKLKWHEENSNKHTPVQFAKITYTPLLDGGKRALFGLFNVASAYQLPTPGERVPGNFADPQV